MFLFISINFAVAFLVVDGSSTFHKVRASGNTEMLVVDEHHKSHLQCAVLCDYVRERSCTGYSFDSDSRQCILYNGRIIDSPSGEEIYLRISRCNNNDGFQEVSADGLTFCYKYVTDTKDYKEAGNYCNALGAYLLHFDSVSEYRAVSTIVTGSKGWVGADDINNEGTWIAAKDGEALDESVWLWKSGEPNNFLSREDCAVLAFDSFTLNDEGCTQTLPFVCEK